jgi:kynureninase
MTNFSKTRQMFDIPEGMVYLNGNSLGPMPKKAPEVINNFLINEWRTELVKGWNTKNWFIKSNLLGDRIGSLIGAANGTTVVGDSLSIKVFQAVAAALAMAPKRRVILSDNGNFPTDLYMVEGLINLRDAGYVLRTPDPEDVFDQITDEVAVVMITEVDYRNSRKHDMKTIIAKAHSVGATVVWDMAHSIGAIPIDVTDTNTDFAVGCTYKYLNGGPGSPAFIYVAPRLLDIAEPALSGWFAHEAPFAFDLNFRPTPSKIDRMRIGTQSIAAFTLLETALDIWDGVNLDDVRSKSIELSELFISQVEAKCHGLTLVSPRDPNQRGSHVAFQFENGYECMQALIAHGVIGDFRAPDIMRFGITPLFINLDDIEKAVTILSDILTNKIWKKPEFQKRALVT